PGTAQKDVDEALLEHACVRRGIRGAAEGQNAHESRAPSIASDPKRTEAPCHTASAAWPRRPGDRITTNSLRCMSALLVLCGYSVCDGVISAFRGKSVRVRCEVPAFDPSGRATIIAIRGRCHYIDDVRDCA